MDPYRCTCIVMDSSLDPLIMHFLPKEAGFLKFLGIVFKFPIGGPCLSSMVMAVLVFS